MNLMDFIIDLGVKECLEEAATVAENSARLTKGSSGRLYCIPISEKGYLISLVVTCLVCPWGFDSLKLTYIITFKKGIIHYILYIHI